MNEEIFRRCNTSCEAIHRLVVSISRGVAGAVSRDDLEDDLVGQGWILALEMMESFDPKRGCKISSYLWQRLTWRLKRYYYSVICRHEVDPLSSKDNLIRLSTEAVPSSGVYEGNPYTMGPDAVYEKWERAKLWTKLKDENASMIERCLLQTPPNSDVCIRTRLSRLRQRELARLRISMQKMQM